MHGLATSGKNFQINLDRSYPDNPGSPMTVHGTYTMGHGTDLKITGERKELLDGHATFGIRSSHNYFTSDKGGETLQDADAVTEVMIDVTHGSTAEHSERFGGLASHRMVTQIEDKNRPAIKIMKKMTV